MGGLCLFILFGTMYSNRNLCAFFVVMKVDFALQVERGKNLRYYQTRRLRLFYNCIQSLKEENYD